jgi:very-short-patch-repair endonuclease
MRSLEPTRTRAAIDRAIAALAGAQYGVVSHAQLIKLGLGEAAIQWRLRVGRLHRVYRGVYLVGHRAAPDRAAEMAALLACLPDAQISHRSSARLWRMLRFSPWAAAVDVTVVGRGIHGQEGLRIHAVSSIDPCDVAALGPLVVSSPARTVLELASVLSTGGLESVIAEGLRREPPLFTLDDLADQIARNPGKRGVARLRQASQPDGGPQYTHEGAERRLLALMRTHDLPAPESNATVNGLEVDFVWRSARLIVEVDSHRFHLDPIAFERDRLRDAELAAVGYLVIRITWRQLTTTPEAVAARIRHILASRTPADGARTGA